MPKRAFVELSNCRIVAFCHAHHVNYFYIILACRLNKGLAEDGKKKLKKKVEILFFHAASFLYLCNIVFVEGERHCGVRAVSMKNTSKTTENPI